MRLKELEEKYEKLLEELEMQIKELKQNGIEENCKRWRADYDNNYFWIGSACDITCETDDEHSFDDARYVIGNYFRTKEEAEKMVEKIKIYTQLKDLALRLNNGEKIDWENADQAKYYIYYNCEKMKLSYSQDWLCKKIGQIYCLDINFLYIAEQEIGEENLKKLFE